MDTLTDDVEWPPYISTSEPLDVNENPDKVQDLEDGKEEEKSILGVYWEREILLDNEMSFGCLFPDLVSTSWMTNDDDDDDAEEDIFPLKYQICCRRMVV